MKPMFYFELKTCELIFLKDVNVSWPLMTGDPSHVLTTRELNIVLITSASVSQSYSLQGETCIDIVLKCRSYNSLLYIVTFFVNMIDGQTKYLCVERKEST